MPLYDDSSKIGFGLWTYPVFAFVLELAVLFGSMYLYLRRTQSTSPVGRYGMVIFGFMMLVVQSIVFIGPPPSSEKTAAIMALFFYFVFAGVVYWLQGKRVLRIVSQKGTTITA
jgi:hypothetical protein